MYYLTNKEFLKPEFKIENNSKELEKSQNENIPSNLSVKTKEFKLTKKAPIISKTDQK